MKLIISGKGIDLTEGIKGAIETKLAKFDKYFTNDVNANITCKVQKNNQIIEITIPVRGNIVRVTESSSDLYTSLDNAIDKLDRQIKKFRNKIRDKKMRAIVRVEEPSDFSDVEVEEVKEEINIVKNKSFEITSMNPTEACEQLELLNHNFFIFINSDNNKFSVVYKRYDGQYGLIECNNAIK